MNQQVMVSVEVAKIFATADVDIAARKPVCMASGRCCHFEEWGQLLYVTEVELMHFAQVHETQNILCLPQFFAQDMPQGCPFQAGKMCTVRAGRPLGCRVYFCDVDAKAWQNEVYEKYHAQLLAVHERFGVPYRYLEWREALRGMLP